MHEATVDAGQPLRSNHDLTISDSQNSLKVGTCGPALLEDQLLRKKITAPTTRAFPNASSMPAGLPRTTSCRSTNRKRV